MNFEIIFVLVGLIGMLVALIMDKMRPGIVLLSLVVVFMAAGIITPKQMVAGFSNRGMITVALLFLVSEGIRQSGALATVIKKLLPERKMTVLQAQLRLLPVLSLPTAFPQPFLLPVPCSLCPCCPACARFCSPERLCRCIGPDCRFRFPRACKPLPQGS